MRVAGSGHPRAIQVSPDQSGIGNGNSIAEVWDWIIQVPFLGAIVLGVVVSMLILVVVMARQE